MSTSAPGSQTRRAIDLAQELVNDAYGALFRVSADQAVIAKIWNRPGNPAALEALIDDKSAAAKARFVSAEVLFASDFTFVARHDPDAIARIYATALREGFTGHLNDWGLLWYDDSAGRTGSRLVGLGAPAIPVLRELLSDRRVLRGYAGSETATIGNAARFRVRDFAAYYLSRIVAHRLDISEPEMTPDDTMRDAAIDKLVATLRHD